MLDVQLPRGARGVVCVRVAAGGQLAKVGALLVLQGKTGAVARARVLAALQGADGFARRCAAK